MKRKRTLAFHLERKLAAESGRSRLNGNQDIDTLEEADADEVLSETGAMLGDHAGRSRETQVGRVTQEIILLLSLSCLLTNLPSSVMVLTHAETNSS